MCNSRLDAVVALLFACSCAPATLQADWPQWRGPLRDGTIEGFAPPRMWPAELRTDWSVEVGEGHASPVWTGSHVLVFTRLGNEEEIGRAHV